MCVISWNSLRICLHVLFSADIVLVIVSYSNAEEQKSSNQILEYFTLFLIALLIHFQYFWLTITAVMPPRNLFNNSIKNKQTWVGILTDTFKIIIYFLVLFTFSYQNHFYQFYYLIFIFTDLNINKFQCCALNLFLYILFISFCFFWYLLFTGKIICLF